METTTEQKEAVDGMIECVEEIASMMERDLPISGWLSMDFEVISRELKERASNLKRLFGPTDRQDQRGD